MLNKFFLLLWGAARRQYGLPMISYALMAFACEEAIRSTPVVSRFGHFCSEVLYTTYLIIGLGSLLIRARAWRDPQIAWRALDLSLVSFIVAQGLKVLTRFPRPSGSPTGFPSGHTLFSFGIAWMILETYPRMAPLVFFLSAVVGWSRVEIRAHYVYQVLVGGIMGMVLGYWVRHQRGGVLLPRLFRRKVKAVKPGTDVLR